MHKHLILERVVVDVLELRGAVCELWHDVPEAIHGIDPSTCHERADERDAAMPDGEIQRHENNGGWTCKQQKGGAVTTIRVPVRRTSWLAAAGRRAIGQRGFPATRSSNSTAAAEGTRQILTPARFCCIVRNRTSKDACTQPKEQERKKERKKKKKKTEVTKWRLFSATAIPPGNAPLSASENQCVTK